VGDEYTFFILERTRTFFEMGKVIFPRLEHLANSGGWEAVDTELQATKWVGPTISKMFLVSTHLCLPRLGLLDKGCEVGIGAQEAFKLLWPGSQAAKDYSMLPDRREVLHRLLARLSAVDPRLAPLIAWAAKRAGEKLAAAGVPAEVAGALDASLTPLGLQVALCEWRKFRSHADPQRKGGKGMALE